jgi:hypothetical protein
MSTRKNKKSFLVPMPTLPLLSIRTQLAHKTLLLAKGEQLFVFRKAWAKKTPGTEEAAPGVDQGRTQ